MLTYLSDLPAPTCCCCCPRVHVLCYRDSIYADTTVVQSIHDCPTDNRYENVEGQLMVTAPAGSAVLFNPNIFHGNFPNVGDRSRSMIALSYRPQWAGPCGDCPAWPADKLAQCSTQAREMLG